MNIRSIGNMSGIGSRPTRCGAFLASTILTNVSVGALAAGMILSAGAAQAQSANPGQSATGRTAKSTQLQEVVVTARYKKENLQKTPIAITAISASQMEARAITTVSDVAAVAPSVELTPSGGGQGKSVIAFIRGAGQADALISGSPGVGMYLDDIYLGTMFGSQASLGDTGRIEVDRGPQGTLAGMNSEGGSVKIYSVQPHGGNTGFIEVGYGSYNRTRVRAAFDTTLIPDRLFMRVFGAADKADGYVTRVDYVCSHPSAAGQGTIGLQSSTNASGCKIGDEGSIDQRIGRVAFKFLATPDLTINLSAQVARDAGSATPDVPILIDPNYRGQSQGIYNTNVLIPAFGMGVTQRLVSKNPYVTYSTFNDPLTGRSVPAANTANTQDITLRGDWKLGDIGPLNNMVLTSISGYHESDGEYTEDFGGPVTFELVDNLMHSTQYSEELRMGGDSFDHKLEWTVGGYYFQNNSLLSGNVNIAGLVIPLPSPPFPGPSIGLNFGQHDPEADRNASAFIHAMYHITPKLTFEAGARYSYNSKSYTFNRPLYSLANYGGSFSLFNPAPGGSVLFPSQGAISRSYRTDPKFGLQYAFTPSLNGYVQYSTGFKAGGINGRPVFASEILPYAPEVVTAYEAGVKSAWFDNTLRANGAIYLNKISQMQESALTVGLPGNVVTNAGSATVKGVELEIDARPVPDLVLNASGDYMDFKYDTLGGAGYSAANPGGIFMNDKLPDVPAAKFDLGAQYTLDFKEYGNLTPRVDFNWQSRIYFESQNNPISSQGAYGLTNLHLIYASDDGKWKAQLDVLNATDKLYYLYKFGSVLVSNGYMSGEPGQPRTFLFTIKRNL